MEPPNGRELARILLPDRDLSCMATMMTGALFALKGVREHHIRAAGIRCELRSRSAILIRMTVGRVGSVSYTHLTLPTNREV